MIAGVRGLRASVAGVAVALLASTVVAQNLAPPTPEPAAISAAAQLARDCGLRFDGVYEFVHRSMGTVMNASILRFFEDGSVVNPDGPFLGELLRKIAHGERFPAGSYRLEKTVSDHHSCLIRIQFGSHTLSGTTRTEIVTLSGGGVGWFGEVTRKYQFEPVNYEKVLQEEKASKERGRELLRKRAEEAAAKLVVQLGSATMGESCSSVEFAPSPPPLRLPPLTRTLAYQVTGISESVKVEIGALCPSGDVLSRTCYELRREQPSPFLWTTVVSCGGDAAFRPGSYELRAFAEGILAKTVPFTVAGASHRKAPQKSATTRRPRP